MEPKQFPYLLSASRVQRVYLIQIFLSFLLLLVVLHNKVFFFPPNFQFMTLFLLFCLPLVQEQSFLVFFLEGGAFPLMKSLPHGLITSFYFFPLLFPLMKSLFPCSNNKVLYLWRLILVVLFVLWCNKRFVSFKFILVEHSGNLFPFGLVKVLFFFSSLALLYCSPLQTMHGRFLLT